MTRTTLRLTLSCNNHCVFCSQAGLQPDPSDPHPVDALCERLQELRVNAEEVTLIGGEPTLHPALVAVVEAARDLGYARIGLQSNGRELARDGLAAALAAAGLTDVHVSLHGDEAPCHDYHTGVAGSFEALLAGVAACRAQRLTVAATTVLTRSGFRSMANLPWLLKSRGAAAWSIAVPRARGRAARPESLHRVLPRLGLALPYALHALAAASRLGLPAWIQGAPLCLLGRFAARSLPAPAASFADGCCDCPAIARCPGLDPAYLRRFAGDEVTCLPESPPRDHEHAELARLFVGAGEPGASPNLEAIPAPPGVTHGPLIDLGKARPARED